jgi:RNA recognition motif-containing protein
MAATATNRTKCTIHVSSLPAETTKEILLAAFIPFGEIIDIQIPLNDEGTQPNRKSLPFQTIQYGDLHTLNTKMLMMLQKQYIT